MLVLSSFVVRRRTQCIRTSARRALVAIATVFGLLTFDASRSPAFAQLGDHGNDFGPGVTIRVSPSAQAILADTVFAVIEVCSAPMELAGDFGTTEEDRSFTDEQFWLSYADDSTDISSTASNTTSTYISNHGASPSWCHYDWTQWNVHIPTQRGDFWLSVHMVDDSAWDWSGGHGWWGARVPVRSIQVTATDGYRTLKPSASDTLRFITTNRGAAADSVNYVFSCTESSPFCPSSLSRSYALLGVNAADTLKIPVTAGSAGDTGTVHFEALSTLPSGIGLTGPTIGDSAWTHTLVATAPSAGVVIVRGGTMHLRDQCMRVGVNPALAVQCGALIVEHALPSRQIWNKTQTPVLYYASDFANPHPEVLADVTINAGGSLPSTVTARLIANNDTCSKSWSGSDWGATGATRRIAIGKSAAWGTGVYQYSLQVSETVGGSTTTIATVTDTLVIVDRSASPFGAGWWLDGLEQLYVVNGSKRLVVLGDGSTRFYDSTAANTWVAKGPDHPDTLTYSAGTYSRHLPNGAHTDFDAAGNHIATVNRQGLVTAFTHATVNGRTVMDTISSDIPSGHLHRIFSYNSSGQLDSVVGATVVKVTPDSIGRITQITDPDATTVNFGYDGGVPFRIVSRTNKLSVPTTFTYDTSGAVTSHRLMLAAGDTIVQRYEAAETKGVATALAVDSAFSRVDGPRTDVSDLTTVWFTGSGAVTRTRDALGHETHLGYGDSRFPGLPDTLVDPVGFRQRAVYNSRGLLDSMIAYTPLGSGSNAVTTYAWHSTLSLPVSITDPVGVITQIHYDSLTGNVLWRQVGPDSARVYFTYASDVLPFTVTEPGTNPDTTYYEGSYGNYGGGRPPSGAVWLRYGDTRGRDSVITRPTTGSDTGWVRFQYDEMDRVTRQVIYGPSMSASLPIGTWATIADSAEVKMKYDAEGRLDTVWRYRGADPRADTAAALVSYYKYDAAGRQVLKHDPGRTDSVVYDHAGNVTQQIGPLGTIVMTYDAAGQLVKRILPSTSFNLTIGTTDLAPDTAIFGYDAAGRVVRADNNYARLARTYAPAGWMTTEVATYRNYFSAGSIPAETNPDTTALLVNTDWSTYAQTNTLTRTYDLAGRVHSDANDATVYGYDAARGLVDSITAFASDLHLRRYDAAGRMVATSYPGGVTDSMSYAADGRLHSRRVGTSGTAYLNDTGYVYDGQDRITSVVNLVRHGGVSVHDTARTWYTGLGAVAAAQSHDTSATIERFAVDALGNRLEHRLTPPPSPGDAGTTTFYYDSAARVVAMRDSTANYTNSDAYSYGPSGAQKARSVLYTDSTGSTYYDPEWYFMGPDDRVHAASRGIYTGIGGVNDENEPVGIHGVGQEFRYDALGRRIFVRADRLVGCNGAVVGALECASYFEWIGYSGDQVWWESRTDQGWRVYAFGNGLDAPLAVAGGTTILRPHANWRGLAEFGTLEDGTSTITCMDPASTTCPRIEWPGATVSVDQAVIHPDSLSVWMGDELTNETDASGLQYKRNRYYDPRTGTFTQTDPIGLAGGANLYGLGLGDPINEVDPLGLFPSPRSIVKCLGFVVAISGATGMKPDASAREMQECTEMEDTGEEMVNAAKRKTGKLFKGLTGILDGLLDDAEPLFLIVPKPMPPCQILHTLCSAKLTS